MKDEAKIWLKYAEENLKSAEILLQSSLYNPCLQNTQQCIVKALKALLIEKVIVFKRTHDILELNHLLVKSSVFVDISEEECDLINSIYLPTNTRWEMPYLILSLTKIFVNKFWKLQNGFFRKLKIKFFFE